MGCLAPKGCGKTVRRHHPRAHRAPVGVRSQRMLAGYWGVLWTWFSSRSLTASMLVNGPLIKASMRITVAICRLFFLLCALDISPPSTDLDRANLHTGFKIPTDSGSVFPHADVQLRLGVRYANIVPCQGSSGRVITRLPSWLVDAGGARPIHLASLQPIPRPDFSSVSSSCDSYAKGT